MRRRRNRDDSFQIPLMYAFRDAHDSGDAKKRLDDRVGGEKVISGRGSLKRRGADEALLKKNLSIDLTCLMNTVDLASVIDLSGMDYVSRSVLNFGLYDVSHLTTEEVGIDDIARSLARSLVEHEPRINPETLHVEREAEKDDVNQRVRFKIAAEMACRPLDVPIEFVAEIDVGSGKLHLTRMPGNI